MKSLKLYKVLQKHTGRINSLVMALQNDEKETDDALTEALTEIKKTKAELTEK